MQLIETALGRLGSRLTLHFLPKLRQVRLSPFGKFYDKAWQLKLGFRVGDEIRLLPFAGNDAKNFPEVEMEITATSITFRARDRQLNLWASFKFVAPFYPQDERISLLPCFLLEVTLDNAPTDAQIEFIAQLELLDDSAKTMVAATPKNSKIAGGVITTNYAQIKTHWGPRTTPANFSEKSLEAPLLFGLYNQTASVKVGDKGVAIEAAAQRGQKFELVLASYFADTVLQTRQKPQVFKYTRTYDSLEAVANFAIANSDYLRDKSRKFDKLLEESSLGLAQQNFIAFAFQSYIINTWWTLGQDATGNIKEWFSAWEGNCVFHSTVDVEYNLAWFYLLLWPQLLEMTLAEWREYLHEDERGFWLSHDMGGLLEANRQVYPHQMEVEENCNFVLLTYALWKFTGREEFRRDNAETVAKLIQFVLDSDTTGNGFPNRGIANTVDDASPAVQFGKEQIYLAVKALSACWATIALLPDDAELGQKCREQVDLISKTLEAQAWLSDHYAVTLDRTTDGLINPWTNEPLPQGELKGWDAYTLYTSNGLLYLLATDTTEGKSLPPLNWQHLQEDLQNSLEKSLIEYGCTHSSSDKSNIWVSQNLHRDLIGAYLGLDLSDMTERYWVYEQYENGEYGRGGCFVDTYGLNHLRYYPRGITSLGLLWALSGARLDRVAGKLKLNPVRVPLRLPLLALADWQQERVPWVNFSLQNGEVEFEIENRDLLQGLEIATPDIFENSTYTLRSNQGVLGFIKACEGDWPWMYCKFEPTVEFAKVQYLFEKAVGVPVLSEDLADPDETERGQAIQNLELSIVDERTGEEIKDFLLNIDGDKISFRY